LLVLCVMEENQKFYQLYSIFLCLSKLNVQGLGCSMVTKHTKQKTFPTVHYILKIGQIKCVVPGMFGSDKPSSTKVESGIAIFREILQQIFKYTCCEYHTMSINSSSLCDCDAPDKIMISPPFQEGCDKVQISSDGANFG
jgi:hypothetical protein